MLVQSPGEDAGPQTGAAERVGSPVRVSISFVTRVMVRVVRAKLKPRGGSLPTGDLSRGRLAAVTGSLDPSTSSVLWGRQRSTWTWARARKGSREPGVQVTLT